MTAPTFYPPEVRELASPDRTIGMSKDEANARRRRAVEVVQRVFYALEGEGMARYSFPTPAVMWDDIHTRCRAVLSENNRLAATKISLARHSADEMVGVREVAFMIGLSVHGLRKRLQTGHDHPPYVRYGEGPQARYVFRKVAVQKWIRGQEIKAKIGRPKGGKKRTTKKGTRGAAPVLEHKGHQPSPLQGPHLWPAGRRQNDAGADGAPPWPDLDPVG